jgi:beta-galactosidase
VLHRSRLRSVTVPDHDHQHHPLFIGGRPGWTEPGLTGIGRLASRAPITPYPTPESARTGVRERSPWFRDLTGVWDFRLKPNPTSVTWADIIDEGPEWEQITVPGTWNDVRNFDNGVTPPLHGDRGTPHYTNVLMPFGEEPPFVPAEDNPTGIYRTFVDVDAAWMQRRTVLHLGGTDSMHYVFVNGQPVGVGTDTRMTSEYDITEAMRTGRNTVVVVVVRWSANTWLEDQDQWWMSGITREVILLSLGNTHLHHVRVSTDVIDPLGDEPAGVLTAEAHIRFATGVATAGWTVRTRLETVDGSPVSGYTQPDDTYPLPLLPGQVGLAQLLGLGGNLETQPIALEQVDQSATVPILDRTSLFGTAIHGNFFPGHRVRLQTKVPNAKLWSTESPTRYRLICELVSPDGELTEVVAQLVGFRKVEVVGRELLLNGKPVLIRGVNRHDHDEITAASPSRSTLRQDIEVMKQFNVNAVRMSHYPPDPYVLDVCDELGLWVIDEANLETHARFRQLVHEPLFQTQCLERLTRMVMRDENHPSIFAWSLGNESGYGPVHDSMAAWVRHYDPTRIVHYEGPHRYDLGPHGRSATDLIAPMYSPIDNIVAWAQRQHETPDDHRPLILCEYSHAMGNSNGSLADYDIAFRSHHGLQGGFIWEWIDHGLRVGTDLDGRSVWAYGGHFGETPHDGAFVADGLVWPDRTPHPGLWEAAHIWRPVRTSLSPNGDLLITNERDFSHIDDLQCTYEVLVNGTVVELGSLDAPPVAPGETVAIPLPGAHLRLDPGDEGHVTVRWSTKLATAWAAQNHVVAWDQVALPVSGQPARSAISNIRPDLQVVDDRIVATGASATVEHRATGQLDRLLVQGQPVLVGSPEVRIWRARIDNDGVPAGVLGLPGIGQVWAKQGLREAHVRTVHDVSQQGDVLRAETTHRFEPAGSGGSAVRIDETRTVTGDGTVVFRYRAVVPEELGDLPRLGTVFTLEQLEQLEWFGLGPMETYADRRSSATVGRWKSTVSDQYVPYIHPQDHGRHEATRWVHVHNGQVGVVAAAHPDMRLLSFSARHFDDGELNDTEIAGHLIPRVKTILSIDHRVRGLGTGSCGPDTLPAYRIGAGEYEWAFAICPWVAGQDPHTVARGIAWE